MGTNRSVAITQPTISLPPIWLHRCQKCPAARPSLLLLLLSQSLQIATLPRQTSTPLSLALSLLSHKHPPSSPAPTEGYPTSMVSKSPQCGQGSSPHPLRHRPPRPRVPLRAHRSRARGVGEGDEAAVRMGAWVVAEKHWGAGQRAHIFTAARATCLRVECRVDLAPTGKVACSREGRRLDRWRRQAGHARPSIRGESSSSFAQNSAPSGTTSSRRAAAASDSPSHNHRGRCDGTTCGGGGVSEGLLRASSTAKAAAPASGYQFPGYPCWTGGAPW